MYFCHKVQFVFWYIHYSHEHFRSKINCLLIYCNEDILSKTIRHFALLVCHKSSFSYMVYSGLHLKCDGTRAETTFRLSEKRTSQFKSAGSSVQSTTGSRGVLISGSNAGYTMFRGSVKGTGNPLHWAFFPSFPLPCVSVCHHVSNGLCLASPLIRLYRLSNALLVL